MNPASLQCGQLAGGVSKSRSQPIQSSALNPQAPQLSDKRGGRSGASYHTRRLRSTFTQQVRGRKPAENAIQNLCEGNETLVLRQPGLPSGEGQYRSCLVTVSHAFEESGERTSWVTELAARVTGAVN